MLAGIVAARIGHPEDPGETTAGSPGEPRPLHHVHHTQNREPDMNALTPTRLGIAALLLGAAPLACAGPSLDYNASPLNYQNSDLNYDNSPLNYRNSPLNFENSPLNLRSTNGIYDTRGNRIGYEVEAPSGVTNFFDNQGNRIGYQPAPRGTR